MIEELMFLIGFLVGIILTIGYFKLKKKKE